MNMYTRLGSIVAIAASVFAMFLSYVNFIKVRIFDFKFIDVFKMMADFLLVYIVLGIFLFVIHSIISKIKKKS